MVNWFVGVVDYSGSNGYFYGVSWVVLEKKSEGTSFIYLLEIFNKPSFSSKEKGVFLKSYLM